MGLRERVMYVREFRSLFVAIKKDNPSWSNEEVVAYSLEQMKSKYGKDVNWSEIIKMILEFIIMLLPFFFEKD